MSDMMLMLSDILDNFLQDSNNPITKRMVAKCQKIAANLSILLNPTPLAT